MYTCIYLYAYLQTFHFLYSDINECTGGSNPCSDICENTIGSYVCKCNDGRRAKDATTCIGIEISCCFFFVVVVLFCFF
jgi:hypothetical protein